jgi:hypothetical protein
MPYVFHLRYPLKIIQTVILFVAVNMVHLFVRPVPAKEMDGQASVNKNVFACPILAQPSTQISSYICLLFQKSPLSVVRVNPSVFVN